MSDQSHTTANGSEAAAHADFQTNRSDPGLGVVDRILARYTELSEVSCQARLAIAEQTIADQLGIITRKNAALDRIAKSVADLAESVEFARKIK